MTCCSAGLPTMPAVPIPTIKECGVKGRAAMGLDDDSDEAEGAGGSSPKSKKARKNLFEELRTISCRGIEVEARNYHTIRSIKAGDKTRGIAVPLEMAPPEHSETILLPSILRPPARAIVRRRGTREGWARARPRG